VISYTTGHIEWSGYLQIPYVSSAAESTVFLGSMFGACLGFLWYNCHPAEVFMGDTGALSLGATLGVVAIMIKQELLLLMVAGVFIMEALSVLLQVSYFKYSGGKRIFKMAPLHHHFELSGWSEQKVVVRFWIAAIIFALFSLTTLKLR
jgi:phospho-N-acetylmuramoyl-pentapeptide-transferase